MTGLPGFTGVGTLTRFSLRRSRVLIGAWTAVLTVLCYASAVAPGRLYPTSADQVSAARSINASSALVALYGPILDVHSLGELAMTKTTVTYAVLVMALTIALVRRHTRVEEESGRAELLGGLALDPLAPLVSAVCVGSLVSVLVAALAAVGDIGGGLPTAGSLWFAASWLGVGLVGTGIGAVCAQLSANARTCGAAGAGVVALLFALRALGDTTSVGWLSWLSPFGWSTQLRAWSAPRGWLLLLDVVLALLLVGGALALRARRDLGSGLVADRPGPATGSPRLADALALNLRIHATSLTVWTVACLILGALMAAIVPGVGSILDSDSARRLMERLGGVGALQETLVAALVSVGAIVVSCFVATVVGHGGAEETDGRTEEVLATATTRSSAFTAVAVVALGGAAWLLLVTGAAMALGSVGAQVSAGGVLAAALVQIPAVWVVAALALVAVALRSAWAIAGWVLVVVFFLLGPLAELLQLPGWVAGLSPYSHVPKVPAEPFHLGPELVLTLLATLLVVTAWWRYRERDIG
jgi:ABC-2 type transport system permease protein